MNINPFTFDLLPAAVEKMKMQGTMRGSMRMTARLRPQITGLPSMYTISLSGANSPVYVWDTMFSGHLYGSFFSAENLLSV